MGLVYYQKNVPYKLGVRLNIRDTQGILLTNEDPYVAIDETEIRDFKLANKNSIVDGLIIPAEEPTLDWETANTITDEEIVNILKSFLALKSRLAQMTSIPIVEKFLAKAKETNKSAKIVGLIQERLSELKDEVFDPGEMQGVE